MKYEKEINRRKSFAIISHPDAGKTTLTEKLLLFGGAIQTAGAVKSNKIKKHATSDFMEIERQRGISVATSVMSFEYKGNLINLLDTPGHKDFAEDTYRTLTAVDSVILVIDSVNGVEPQTRRLMEVCSMRATPVIVFINKMDRDGKNRFDLLEEIEAELKISLHPMTWPINSGKEFKGVYNLHDKSLRLFTASTKADDEDVVAIGDLSSPVLQQKVGDRDADLLREDVELIDGVYGALNPAEYLSGAIAPVFFGSAVNNFGVQEMLDTFIQIAPTPRDRETNMRKVQAGEDKFSGFIFKIHANLDPKHRDRIAFVRLCSGHFKRGMKLTHVRTKKIMAIASPMLFLAADRELAEEAWAGDIIGIPNHGQLRIGDALTENEILKFAGIPSFAPELLQSVRATDPMKAKHLDKALNQFAEEGAAKLFKPVIGAGWIIGVVGALQFEVLASRIELEYGIPVRFEQSQFNSARWLSGEKDEIEKFVNVNKGHMAMDHDGDPVYMTRLQWDIDRVERDYPNLNLTSTKDIMV